MRVLLTGASSFLGRHLAAALVQAGHAVTGTYRANPSALGASLNAVQLDLADAAGFAALPRRIDAVVHVAGVSTAPGVSIEDMVACNVIGMRNVIAYAMTSGAEKVIYASTLSVHGRIAVPVVNEATPICDPDAYGASKYEGERLLVAAQAHLPGVAIRLPGVLGRGAHRAWLPTVLAQIRRGEPVAIYNPDAPFNNAAHVEDLGRLIFEILVRPFQGFHAFPVGASGTLTVRAAVERLMACSGCHVPTAMVQAPQPGFTISSDHAIWQFGYRPMEIGAMLDRYARETQLD